MINTETKGKMVLPEKNDTYKHLFAYLIKLRNIDKEVVSEFVDRQLFRGNKNLNKSVPFQCPRINNTVCVFGAQLT